MPEENRAEMNKKQLWYEFITVEPTMFFYMMAFMITNVIEQTFYVFRACTVNHNYSAEICYNISTFPDINRDVQVTVSKFHQWNGIASHIVPLLLAFFLGAYSDKRGRKNILIAGLLGKLYFSFMITINTMHSWPVEYVIYTAAFPSALTGADLAIFTGCFAYIADITTPKNRTLRVSILDVVYLSAMPSGIAIGSWLFTSVLDRSFTAMFAINTCLMVIATVYSMINLKSQTTPEQKSLKDAGVTNPITDFFDVIYILNTLKTLTKKRPSNRRCFLWLLLISMAFYTFQRDERQVMYFYTSAVFQWNETTFSHFRTYLSVLYVFVMLIAIPLMTKLLHWRDTRIMMMGAMAHMCGHLTYALVRADNVMYVGATVASLGPCVAPLIRAMTSKVLPSDERGVAFTYLSVMENAVAMFASVIYSQLYMATINTIFINGIFFLTITTQVVVFLCALTMEIMLKGRKIEDIGEPKKKSITYS